MSLNHVVNSLIRAAASIPEHISDTDLDRHVAQLLANEAKAKEKSWSELGLGAYLGRGSPDPNAPKPNKRFLASVIRNVDGHNAAVIRAQNQAAREAREERRGESSRSAASRLFGGAMRGLQKDERDRERRSAGSSRRERNERLEVSSRHHVRDEDGRRGGRYDDRRQDEHSDRRSRRYDSDEEDSCRGARDRRQTSVEREDREHRRRSRSRSRSKERRKRHEAPEKVGREDRKSRNGEGERRTRYDKREQSQSRSPKRYENEKKRDRYAKYDEEHDKIARTQPPPPPEDLPPPSPSPPPPPARISRMDKYFANEYDPRLDYGEIPATGPVVDVGWDNMLAILKERGHKRRVRSPGLFDDEPVVPIRTTVRKTSPDVDGRKYEKAEKKKRKEERKKRRADSDESEDERRRRKEKKAKESATVTVPAEGEGLFDMKYAKSGATREWDVGK